MEKTLKGPKIIMTSDIRQTSFETFKVVKSDTLGQDSESVVAHQKKGSPKARDGDGDGNCSKK